jgi:hypothetical protein
MLCIVVSGVPVTQSLVLYACFVDRCLSFCNGSCSLRGTCHITQSDGHSPVYLVNGVKRDGRTEIPTVQTDIDCANRYRLYKQISTVQTYIDCTNIYRLYKQISTVQTYIEP